MESCFTIRVRADDIDDLGHVNNAKFLEYMEQARRDWYNRVTSDFQRSLGQELGTVVVNINISFARESFEGDVLRVTTRPRRKGHKSYVLAQTICNQHGESVAEAEVTSVVMDRVRHKAIAVPPPLGRLFDD